MSPGLVNVDITSDVAARLGMAYGTTLPAAARGSCASRDAHPASRMIKRAMHRPASSATGVNVSDLRVALPAVNRHELKVDERAGGLHVRVSADDPDVIQVQLLRAARHPGVRSDAEGDRARVLTAGVPAGEPG